MTENGRARVVVDVTPENRAYLVDMKEKSGASIRYQINRMIEAERKKSVARSDGVEDEF